MFHEPSGPWKTRPRVTCEVRPPPCPQMYCWDYFHRQQKIGLMMISRNHYRKFYWKDQLILYDSFSCGIPFLCWQYLVVTVIPDPQASLLKGKKGGNIPSVALLKWSAVTDGCGRYLLVQELPLIHHLQSS